MNKTGIIILIIIVIAGVWLYQQVEQRKAFENVKIDFDGIGIRSIGLSGVDLDIALKMYNPSSSSTATLDRMDYQVYGNGINLGYGSFDNRISISPGEIKRVTTEYHLPYGRGADVIISAIQNGNVKWGMTGTAYFELPGGGVLPVSFDRR